MLLLLFFYMFYCIFGYTNKLTWWQFFDTTTISPLFCTIKPLLGGTPGMARIPQLDLCSCSVAKIVVVKFQKDLLKEHKIIVKKNMCLQTDIGYNTFIQWYRGRVRVMVFNTTFNNISVIHASWRPVLSIEETIVLDGKHLQLYKK